MRSYIYIHIIKFICCVIKYNYFYFLKINGYFD